MINIILNSSIPILLIAFSYSFLMYNKIYFGVSLILGIILMMVKQKSLSFKVFGFGKRLNVILFFLLFSFLISTLFSIQQSRSFFVVIYLIMFIFFGSNLEKSLSNNEILFNNLIKFFSLSVLANITIILFYNFYESGISTGNFFNINLQKSTEEFFLYEIIKFKGVMNIMTVLILLLPFFNNSKKYFFSSLLLIPCIILSNSNSSILGILVGLIVCGFYIVTIKIKNKRTFLTISAVIFFILTFSFLKKLPSNINSKPLKNYTFDIPISILDAHRQFIWSFSIQKSLEKPFFGYGPDTSNFIEGGQEIIGNYYTGTMVFIPSHPHNFFIELILETGFIGSLIFIFFILFLNKQILNLCNFYQGLFLIFFNGYFWGSSLVNFSFWQGWWQGSYFFILALIISKVKFDRKRIN